MVAIVVATCGCNPWFRFVGAIVGAFVVAPSCRPWLQFVVAIVVAFVVAISAADLEICVQRKTSASDTLALPKRYETTP